MCTEIKINQFPSEVTYDNNEINIKVTVDSVNKDCTINEAKVDDNECKYICRFIFHFNSVIIFLF